MTTLEWTLLAVIGILLTIIAKPFGKLPNVDRPPTDKQLEYIEILREERDADDLQDESPETLEEASQLISELKYRP